MIRLSKEQIDSALPKVADGLAKYRALQNDLCKVNVATDIDYQRRFNHFYRIRRNAEWQFHFYMLLQRNKRKGITFQDALRAMHKYTGRIEASYVSKLVATINPLYPVIDRFVLQNAGLRLPYARAMGRELRIITIYHDLQSAINEFLKKDNGRYLVREFKKTFPKARITAIKMVDFVLWQTR